MVMEVMELLETSQVGDARDVLAAMVLLVVHDYAVPIREYPSDQPSR